MSRYESLLQISERAERQHTGHKNLSNILQAKIEVAERLEPDHPDREWRFSIVEGWRTLRQFRAEHARKDFEENFERHIEAGIAKAKEAGIEINYRATSG